MGRNAVGFYWTLPVPWAGFRRLPDGIEEASKASRTIRYQVQRVRSYAQEEGFTLIREDVFLEVAPDRGTDYVFTALRKVENYCRVNSATLLYVDFSQAQGWRSHPPMEAWSQRKRIESVPIWPDPVRIDGEDFDPRKHFRQWRDRQENWSEGKVDRIAKALARARILRSEGCSYERIAGGLEAENLRSASGKVWTGEMVRKLLGSSAA